MSIRDKLLALIEADGREPNDLARATGLAVSTVGKFVSGARGHEPSAEFVVLLGRELGLKAKALGEMLLESYPPRKPIMTATEMTATVGVELDHIASYPKGPQTELRSHYNMVRRKALGPDPWPGDISPAGVLASCIAHVRKRYPDFKPQYDAEFFGLLPETSEDE